MATYLPTRPGPVAARRVPTRDERAAGHFARENHQRFARENHQRFARGQGTVSRAMGTTWRAFPVRINGYDPCARGGVRMHETERTGSRMFSAMKNPFLAVTERHGC
eukprot:6211431-Pleurochrysis_carterae.AAC.2